MKTFYATIALAISLFAASTPCTAIEAQVVRHQLRVSDLPSPSNIAARKEYPSMGVSELTLSNGLRILIKPTDYDEDEVSFQMYAMGGYASLEHDKMPSGKLAALAAYEAGFAKASAAAIQDVLSHEEIEFKLKIKLACRVIEGSSSEDGLKTAFKLIHLIFTKGHPTNESMQRVLATSDDVCRLRSRNPEQHFEDIVRSVNTGDHSKLRPVSVDRLGSISTDLAQDFFQQCFGNPSDFTLVVVGDCDVDRVLDLALRYLGNIPVSRQSFSVRTELDLPFPHHPLVHRFTQNSEVEDRSRITMPLALSMTEDVWCELDALTQVVETRLHRRLKEKTGSSLAVDVAYEFPLYPDPSVCWMTIQYRTKPKYTKQTQQLILSEIERLVQEGPSEKEWELSKRVLRDNDALWFHENHYWLSMLANYKKWNWPLEGLAQRKQRVDQLRRESIHSLMKKLLNPQRHTTVTMRDPNSK